MTCLSLPLAKPSVILMYYFSKSLPVAIQTSIVKLAVSFLLINKLPPPTPATPRFDCVIDFGLQGQEGENRMERTNSGPSPKGRWCPPWCVPSHSPVCDESRAPPGPSTSSVVPLSRSLGSNAGRELPCSDPFPEYFQAISRPGKFFIKVEKGDCYRPVGYFSVGCMVSILFKLFCIKIRYLLRSLPWRLQHNITGHLGDFFFLDLWSILILKLQ